MKIISPFKDYYDRITYEYGGGDPHIPYLRLASEQYQTIEIKYPVNYFGDSDYHTDLNKSLRKIHEHDIFNYMIPTYKWLVFCGKYYLIIVNEVPTTDYCVNPPGENNIPKLGYSPCEKVLTRKYNSDIYDYILDSSEKWDEFYKQKAKSWYSAIYPQRVYRFEDVMGKRDVELDEISKLLTAKLNRPIPMFIIDKDSHSSQHRTFWHGIQKKDIPVNKIDLNLNVCLNDLGFASVMSAEQAYQEIESYIVNVLRTNPDKEPPVQIDDKDKIDQHGFDKKISFRHRK